MNCDYEIIIAENIKPIDTIVSNGDLILRQERSTEDTQIVLTATPVNKTTFWLFVMYWDKKFLKRIEKDKKQQTLNAL